MSIFLSNDQVVDGSGNEYLRTVCSYVHLNPSRAGLVGAEEPLKRYQWSSFGELLKSPRKRANWLRVDRLFGDLGLRGDSLAGRRQFERIMESQRKEEEPEGFSKVRRGWCLGPKEFRKGLLEEMTNKVTIHHYGAERRESAEAKAERILKEELRRVKWMQSDLTLERKGHVKKIAIAKRLREETTMTMAWIAEHTWMGSESNVRKLLNRTETKKK